MKTTVTRSIYIKDLAKNLGFSYCGIAKAEKLETDARKLEKWLHQGMHGQMQYMENHFELRVDPRKLVPGAKSVITLLQNYYPAQIQPSGKPAISKYAYGEDYHEVIRTKLKTLLQQITEQIGQINGRGFVDSAPVLERSWAQKSGLGWIGKNGNLLTKKTGSFFFIATLFVDMELAYDDPFAKDYCGSCRKCIEACPTNAILDDKVVDGSKCISYFTIELKENLIPSSMKGQFEDWVFGCDTCQDVCPWNRFSTPTSEEKFTPLPEIFEWNTQDWAALQEENFKKIFKHSPLKRTGFKGIQRNLTFLQLK